MPAKGKKLVEFLKWALTKGEEMAKDLDYAPLPENFEQRVLKRVSTKSKCRWPRQARLGYWGEPSASQQKV